MKKIIFFICSIMLIQITGAMNFEVGKEITSPDIIASLRPFKESSFSAGRLVAFNPLAQNPLSTVSHANESQQRVVYGRTAYICAQLKRKVKDKQYVIICAVIENAQDGYQDVENVKIAHDYQLKLLPEQPLSPTLKREKSKNFRKLLT